MNKKAVAVRSSVPQLDVRNLISKREAAARAGLSPRQILALAKDGIIRSKKVKDHSHQMAVMVHRGDLDKYIATFRKPAAEVMARPSQPDPDDFMEKIALLKAALMPAPEPVRKLWLTLEEAADYTGLPASVLLMLIEFGELMARNVGVRIGGRYRVLRSDLDAIVGIKQVKALTAHGGK